MSDSVITPNFGLYKLLLMIITAYKCFELPLNDIGI